MSSFFPTSLQPAVDLTRRRACTSLYLSYWKQVATYNLQAPAVTAGSHMENDVCAGVLFSNVLCWGSVNGRSLSSQRMYLFSLRLKLIKSCAPVTLDCRCSLFRAGRTLCSRAIPVKPRRSPMAVNEQHTIIILRLRSCIP